MTNNNVFQLLQTLGIDSTDASQSNSRP